MKQRRIEPYRHSQLMVYLHPIWEAVSLRAPTPPSSTGGHQSHSQRNLVSACVSYSDDRPGFETDALVEQPGIAPTAPEVVDPAIDGVLKLCHKSPGVGPAILKRPFLSSSASMSFRSFRSFRSFSINPALGIFSMLNVFQAVPPDISRRCSKWNCP